MTVEIITHNVYKRWLAVSIRRATEAIFYDRGNHEPTEEEIREFIIRAKNSGYPLFVINRRAAIIRSDEIRSLVGKLPGDKLNYRDYAKAEKTLNHLYSEIDKNPSRNCSFLDNII